MSLKFDHLLEHGYGTRSLDIWLAENMTDLDVEKADYADHYLVYKRELEDGTKERTRAIPHYTTHDGFMDVWNLAKDFFNQITLDRKHSTVYDGEMHYICKGENDITHWSGIKGKLRPTESVAIANMLFEFHMKLSEEFPSEPTDKKTLKMIEEW